MNRQLPLLVILAIAWSMPAAESAADAFKHGVKAEHKLDYDAAFTYYKQAYIASPKDPKYLASYLRMRASAAQRHSHAGVLLRNTGALAEALAEFQRSVEIDSSSFLAQQELRRTTDLIRRQERAKTLPKVETAKVTEEFAPSVELQPLPNTSITLHMTVNADAAYKTICKLAGINVVIDPDYHPQKITIDLTDVTIREALDMVRLQSKTFWRPVLANTILVAAESPAKRKEIEQNVMRTFYLRNISTPAELQEAGNVVRQVLDISRVQLLQAQDALILRGTPDQMVLAEKLLADLDRPKSEVVIDVAVMQVSRDRLRTLGMNVPTSVSIGLLPSISGGSGGSGSSAGFPVGNFVLSVGGGSFTALASDSNTKLLQNPQIRTLNNEKATLRIGDRVPIATGSFAGTVGGTGVSPLVSTQFQYLDVGVNIDITPHIHSDREVTLKLGLEISSVTGSESIGGITQPIIGQRRIEHETRLVDGEVNLLGGILSDIETQSMSGWPWISKLPLLKYLFAQENRDHREDEIIFAITPHIVRAPEVTEENLRQIDVGTGNAIELRHKPPVPVTSAPGDATKPKQPAPQVPAAHGSSTSATPPQASPQTRPAGPE